MWAIIKASDQVSHGSPYPHATKHERGAGNKACPGMLAYPITTKLTYYNVGAACMRQSMKGVRAVRLAQECWRTQ